MCLHIQIGICKYFVHLYDYYLSILKHLWIYVYMIFVTYYIFTHRISWHCFAKEIETPSVWTDQQDVSSNVIEIYEIKFLYIVQEETYIKY